MTDTNIDLNTALADFTMEAVYVPCHAKEVKDMKLQWSVTIFFKGKLLITTPYSAGIAHIPGHEHLRHHGRGLTIHDYDIVKRIVTSGEGALVKYGANVKHSLHSNPIMPKLDSVMYCLISDADVINYASYEDWAANFGYDEDSRKGEKIYKDCLASALQLRSVLGDAKIAELQEAFQDY